MLPSPARKWTSILCSPVKETWCVEVLHKLHTMQICCLTSMVLGDCKKALHGYTASTYRGVPYCTVTVVENGATATGAGAAAAFRTGQALSAPGVAAPAAAAPAASATSAA
eukprot:1154045-Pelagomonas_calceolata.AAC.8